MPYKQISGTIIRPAEGPCLLSGGGFPRYFCQGIQGDERCNDGGRDWGVYADETGGFGIYDFN